MTQRGAMVVAKMLFKCGGCSDPALGEVYNVTCVARCENLLQASATWVPAQWALVMEWRRRSGMHTRFNLVV